MPWSDSVPLAGLVAHRDVFPLAGDHIGDRLRDRLCVEADFLKLLTSGSMARRKREAA